jgi:hypothetical protein
MFLAGSSWRDSTCRRRRVCLAWLTARSPPILRYQTKAAGKMMMGTAMARAAINSTDIAGRQAPVYLAATSTLSSFCRATLLALASLMAV